MNIITKINRFITTTILLSLLTIPSVHAADATGQKFTVSFKKDVFTEKGYEAACIALQLATLMAKKGATVTLFPSLDGVVIANKAHLAWAETYASGNNSNVTGVGSWTCATSTGPTPLPNLITGFVGAGGTILVCPVCWNSRYASDANAELVDGASLGDSNTLSDLFAGSDKILDF
jgi:predicted peroxiredoxin